MAAHIACLAGVVLKIRHSISHSLTYALVPSPVRCYMLALIGLFVPLFVLWSFLS